MVVFCIMTFYKNNNIYYVKNETALQICAG